MILKRPDPGTALCVTPALCAAEAVAAAGEQPMGAGLGRAADGVAVGVKSIALCLVALSSPQFCPTLSPILRPHPNPAAQHDQAE